MTSKTLYQHSYPTMNANTVRGTLASVAFVLLSATCMGDEFGNSGMYKASAWLRYEDSSPRGIDRVEQDRTRFAETQRAMILSPLVMDPVLSRPDVAKIREINSVASPVDLLLQRVTVKQSETTDLWIISAEANDPEDAATLTNAVVESYFRMLTQDTLYKITSKIDELEEERDRQKNHWRSISEELKEWEKQSIGKLNGLGKQWTKEALYQSFLRLREQQDAVALKLVLLELQAGGANSKNKADAKAEKKEATESQADSPAESSAEKPLSLDPKQLAELKELRLYAQALKVREAEVLRSVTELSADTEQDWEFQSRNDERKALETSMQNLSDQIRRLQVESRLPSRVDLLRKAEPPSERE